MKSKRKSGFVKSVAMALLVSSLSGAGNLATAYAAPRDCGAIFATAEALAEADYRRVDADDSSDAGEPPALPAQPPAWYARVGNKVWAPIAGVGTWISSTTSSLMSSLGQTRIVQGTVNIARKLPFIRKKEPKSPMAPEPKVISAPKNIAMLMFAGKRKAPVPEREPDLRSDHDVIDDQRITARLGKMATHFDPELDTRLYYTVNGRPNEDGSMPVVDPQARGLFIYLHGSGTKKASGQNFAVQGSELALMGYSALSFDQPYHFDGPRGRQTFSSDWYMEWLYKLITKYRVPGQPVYIAGHSFGPTVIAELISRYPDLVDGALLISPAAFTPELDAWFYKHTSQATKFWGDTQPNHEGGRALGMATAGFKWNTPRGPDNPDPTIVNPKLNVRIVSGKWEEYFPGPVDENGIPTKEDRTFDVEAAMRPFFANAKFVLEPEVGHYIFLKLDANGVSVVTRQLLAMDGKTPDDIKRLKKETVDRKLSDLDMLAQRYARDAVFHDWVVAVFGEGKMAEMVKAQDVAEARLVLKDFQNAMKQRDAAMFDNIRRTKNWAPEFYEENREAIEKLGQQNYDPARLLTKYSELLADLSPEERERVSHVDPSVLIPPARPQKPARPQREQGGAQDQSAGGAEGKSGLSGLTTKEQIAQLREASAEDYVQGLSELTLDEKLKILKIARTGKVETTDGNRVDRGIFSASKILSDKIGLSDSDRAKNVEDLKVIEYMYQANSGRVSAEEQEKLRLEAEAVLTARGTNPKKMMGQLDVRGYGPEAQSAPVQRDRSPDAPAEEPKAG